MPYNILIVDDHELTQSGLRLLLSQHEAYSIGGRLHNGASVLSFVRAEAVDVIILDLNLPDMNGISLLAELVGTQDMTVVILTGEDSPKDYYTALEMGARAVVSKSDASDYILTALKKSLKGETYCSPSIEKSLGLYVKPATQLSPRQMAILHYLAEGETSKEIGYRLGITAPTVSFHLNELRKKLDVKSNNEVVSQAKILGLL